MPPSATSFVPDCTAFAIEGGKKIVMSSFPDASAAAPPVSVIWTSVNPSSRKYRSAAMIGASHDAHWMRNVVVSGAGSGVGVGAGVAVLAGAAAWPHASSSGATMSPAANAVPRRRTSRRVISCSRFICVSFRLTGFGAGTSDRSARGLWRLDRFDYALEAKTCAFAGVLDRVRRDRVEDQEAD